VEGRYKRERKAITIALDNLDKKGETSRITRADRDAQLELQKQLRVMVREEETRWLQRAKEIEILEGDNNSKYYHTKSNGGEGIPQFFISVMMRGLWKGRIN
jgi:hypothetical protein